LSFFDYPEGNEGDPVEELAFLSAASDDEWQALRSHAQHLRVLAGHLVIPEGSVDRALYIVLEGDLEVTVLRSKRGGERQISVIEAGTVFGEIGFFDSQPRSANVRATTDAALLRLSLETFQVLAAKEPALGRLILLDLGRVLATRLRAVEALYAGVHP
jgi:CRP/FNR family cyclic AMP-dependent transcriptional regulator